MRAAACALAVALAAGTTASLAGRGRLDAYVFTKGSGFASGHELLVPTVAVPRGGRLTLVNLHLWGHSITSDTWAAPNVRLFRSEVIPFGESSVVRGVETLVPGSYGFFCSNHMGMRGTLVVV
jgi:plastocyanin